MTGAFPSELKTAKVIPVFKKDSKLDYSNYCKIISLLSNIEKIFEKLMYKRLYTFLNNNNFIYIRKNIFACLFSVHNTISLSRHEQVCLMRLRFERYFSHHRPDDGRSISRNVASLNILVHDVINLLYYNFIYNLQFGFRRQHSTSHALINVTENIRKALDDGNIDCGVFVGLQKSFDTVDHQTSIWLIG